MGDKYVGPRGPKPNYSDQEGERIRVLLESENPQIRGGVESALLEMGVDPFTARHYGNRGGDPAEINKYLEATKESRKERMRRALQAKPVPGTLPGGGYPSPWSPTFNDPKP